MKYHWTYESWGDAYAPENADEIIDQANELIDLYAGTHDEDETSNYSETLWDTYCRTGSLSSEQIKSIRSSTGMSQARFSATYEIPIRTIQDWERGARTPPAYVIKLLELAAKKEDHR